MGLFRWKVIIKFWLENEMLHGEPFVVLVCQLRFPFSPFFWLGVQDKIFTIDNLVRRRLVMVNWCCM